MAFYIELYKTSEDEENFAYYTYEFYLPTAPVRNAAGKLRGSSKLVNGKIKIDKRNGDVHTIELAEGDNGMYSERASWAS